MKNKNRTNAEWLELCEARRNSGLSRKAWCRREGVEYRSFTDWEYRSRKKANNGVTARSESRSVKTGWIELAPMNNAEGAESAAKDIEPVGAVIGIQVAIGAFRIILPEDFAEGAFKRVCKALGEIC